ncbi:hypothetical protein GCM10022247_28570 [Allokutzneria multivorans]|uniref:Uncharacterized protein n=1 Tax=Allokutzneria multivorans TaxID=1142134 RepID=A0ABP7S1T2_9PSEU
MRDGVVDQLLLHLLGEVGQVEAAPEISEVDPDLAHAQPRDLVPGQRPSVTDDDLSPPARFGQCRGRGGEALARRDEVLPQQPPRPARAFLDVRVAVRAARVHRVLDAGPGPGHQVQQRVGVAREVRDDVPSAPAGERALAADCPLIQPGDDVQQPLGRVLQSEEAIVCASGGLLSAHPRPGDPGPNGTGPRSGLSAFHGVLPALEVLGWNQQA